MFLCSQYPKDKGQFSELRQKIDNFTSYHSLVMQLQKQGWVVFAMVICLAMSEKCSISTATSELIDKTLAPFAEGITADMIAEAQKLSFACSVQIRNSRIAGDVSCLKARLFPIYCTLEIIARKLPDMKLVINWLDEYRVNREGCKDKDLSRRCGCLPSFKPPHSYFYYEQSWSRTNFKIPVFSTSWCPQCFYDIPLPSHSHIGQSLEDYHIPWEQKEFRAVWRGSTTGSFWGFKDFRNVPQSHRQKLVELCLNLSECDTKFSKYHGCIQKPEDCQEAIAFYGKPQWTPLRELAKNKILIDIDGNTYSERFPSYLASGSAVFKIAALSDIAFSLATPYQHYIPVKMDLSDLVEKLEWARNNDEQLRKIAQQGKQFALKTFHNKFYRCYVFELLNRYYKLLRV